MRFVLCILFLFSHIYALAAEPAPTLPTFRFYNSGQKFDSSTFDKQLKKLDFPDQKYNIILVASKSYRDPQTLKQWNILSGDHAMERLQLLFVTASTQDADTHGYYVDAADAQKILAISNNNFAAYLISHKGCILGHWNKPVTVQALLNLLQPNPNTPFKPDCLRQPA